MLEKSKNYVKTANINYMFNYDEFAPEISGKKSIKKKSKIDNQQFTTTP